MNQTRLKDWLEGGLNAEYFFQRIAEVGSMLQQYEMNAVPPDWACHWDRYGILTCLVCVFFSWCCCCRCHHLVVLESSSFHHQPSVCLYGPIIYICSVWEFDLSKKKILKTDCLFKITLLRFQTIVLVRIYSKNIQTTHFLSSKIVLSLHFFFCVFFLNFQTN